MVMDDDTKYVLEQLKASNESVSLKSLAERFEEVDEYFGHTPWNLHQILLNILMIEALDHNPDDWDSIK